MALPVTIPNEFANAATSIPLSQLDVNFSTLANAINGISDGSETLANVTATIINATTIDTTNIEVTNIKAKDGTSAASIADSTGKITVATELAVDNLNFSGNAITSTNTDGDIDLTPDGTGEVNISKVDIAGGEIDAVTLGTNSAVTEAQIDNINIDGNTISTTDTDGNLILSPDGDGVTQEEVGGTNYNLASQYDIGTAPNEIPLNQYLGNLAYQDAGSIAGPVVIGDQSSSDALRITQLGTGNALVVEDSANPDATPFVIDAAGDVLVGTQTSINVDDQGGTQRTPALQVTGTGIPNSTISSSYWAANGFGPNIVLAKSRSGTIGTNSIVQSGDTLGNLVFNGDDGTALIVAAVIQGEVDGTPGANDMPGRLVFFTTADGASTPTERVRIKSNGSVRFQPMAQPASAEAGDVYYDSGTNKLRCYNGSTWNDLF